MKLYDYTRAPNPRRVRIFLAEKGITVPMVQLDLFQGAHLTLEALKRNPYRGLPVLELDDGTCIAESVAICRYFAALYPDPPLMGVERRRPRRGRDVEPPYVENRPARSCGTRSSSLPTRVISVRP